LFAAINIQRHGRPGFICFLNIIEVQVPKVDPRDSRA